MPIRTPQAKAAPPGAGRLLGTALIAAVLIAAALSAITFPEGAGAARAQDAAGAPVGAFRVEGWEPGQDRGKDEPYRGTARMLKRGAMLAYEGIMDGQKYIGVGVWEPKTGTLALHFREVGSDKVGVAHFRRAGDRLEGVWAWTGDPSGRLGAEVWTLE